MILTADLVPNVAPVMPELPDLKFLVLLDMNSAAHGSARSTT